MSIETYSNHWDKKHGFTRLEAVEKKFKLDSEHEINSPNSRWLPAEILPDDSRDDGFMLVCRTK